MIHSLRNAAQQPTGLLLHDSCSPPLYYERQRFRPSYRQASARCSVRIHSTKWHTTAGQSIQLQENNDQSEKNAETQILFATAQPQPQKYAPLPSQAATSTRLLFRRRRTSSTQLRNLFKTSNTEQPASVFRPCSSPASRDFPPGSVTAQWPFSHARSSHLSPSPGVSVDGQSRPAAPLLAVELRRLAEQ